MQITSPEQFHRVARALAETGTLIAKEERYSQHLQKPEYLAWLKSHSDRLIGMMNEYPACELSRVRQIGRLWVVEVHSPVSGWIVQGEHLTKEAAESDRRNWL